MRYKSSRRVPCFFLLDTRYCCTPVVRSTKFRKLKEDLYFSDFLK